MKHLVKVTRVQAAGYNASSPGYGLKTEELGSNNSQGKIFEMEICNQASAYSTSTRKIIGRMEYIVDSHRKIHLRLTNEITGEVAELSI